MAWTKRDLLDARRVYRIWLESRPLAQATIDSHDRYAGFFVGWLYGDYTPRGAAPRKDPLTSSLGLEVDDLRRELNGYGTFLIAAGLKPSGVPTYVEGARLFAKWLDPTILSKAPRDGSQPQRSPGAPPSSQAGAADEPRDAHDWPSESFVQAAIVAELAGRGWRIERVAHTSSREHGIDVLARRDGVRLMVEAKGYPSDVYTAGVLAGQPWKWHPASQARTYFGDALLSVLTMRDEAPDAIVVIALPHVQGYRASPPRFAVRSRASGSKWPSWSVMGR